MTLALLEGKLSKKQSQAHVLSHLSPALSTTHMGQEATQIKHFPKKEARQIRAACCFPPASIEKVVQCVPLTSSDQHFNHRERSGGPFSPLPCFAGPTGGH